MSKFRAVLLAASLVVSLQPATPARAGYLSGADLLQSCKPQVVDAVYRLKVAECRGYVVGVADIFDCDTKAFGFRWNNKAPVSQEQLVNVVVGWLKAHPQNLDYQAGGLIAAALSEKFPCGNN